ncbi:Isoleucine--tRNA ligase [Candidatus Erwinia haradaeae]|uniref:Isoleucine--tRNA ligase n=1 Tax=Candidatus Erwinia haradaeae TaxID=1922217 RepID=A0A451CZG6_9GAMM|nr:isoleucine--tRNA ligase [Candidatus Erwinia haradaeae]VFP78821.1 Isoleucine--tRNA ligase [Candidatus Erwinia haradaeae]
MINYKSTLNLPKTDFPMKGNLAKQEPFILQRWYNDKLYNMIRNAKEGKKTFFLHDGPPYANGNIHIGHAVNKILKDIIIKSKSLSGYNAPYIPGWDCHGLPIEQEVEKSLSKTRRSISKSDFRAACRQYASQQVEQQKTDFIRLGILADWDNPYKTMDFQTEANIIRSLGKMIQKGHLYKGAKPVQWCLNCRSAIAEAEVEYLNKISPSIQVLFDAVDKKKVQRKFSNLDTIGPISIVIWTTTPWTIPANRAISLHPKFSYQLVSTGERTLIIASERVNSCMRKIGIMKWKVLGETSGSELEKLEFHHPFLPQISPIFLGEHVTLDDGTGLVHTAPAHGVDDYIVSQKYEIKVSNSVGPDGCYIPSIHPKLDGKNVFKSNQIIITLLREKNALLYIDTIDHSYPHCWRHKTPIIFRCTPQWFLSMDKKRLRAQSLNQAHNVRWIPEWGQERIISMITNRPDWCISRQRIWGVPLTLFVHKETNQLHPQSLDIIEKVAKLVEINGVQAWWDLKLSDYITLNSEDYLKVSDTLDVWFDSGSTSYSVFKSRNEFKDYLPDLYLEGSDQYRGWFMSSLIISTAITGKAPYREVLTHGFTVDDKGYKMSKSRGNTIRPQEIVNRLGADVLRLWTASTNYSGEIAISNQILKSASESYRRIRNTARFLLSNLIDFNPDTDKIKEKNMVIIDRWVIGRALTVQNEIIASYEAYQFHTVVQRLVQFCSIEMGSCYLDIIKDRQYTAKTKSTARQSCQTALWYIAESLVRWMAPIISFTADELWGYLPGKRTKYVFTEEWFTDLFSLNDQESMNNEYWDTIFKVRSEVNKAIEQARFEKKIGSALETKILLYTHEPLTSMLTRLREELRFIFLSSSSEVLHLDDAPRDAYQSDMIKDLKVVVHKASGRKCLRCWHHTPDVGLNSKYFDLCERCITNIKGDGEERQFV